MTYTPVAQRKQAITTPSVSGYIPVAERQTFSDIVGSQDMRMAQTTSTLPTPEDIGMARLPFSKEPSVIPGGKIPALAVGLLTSLPEVIIKTGVRALAQAKESGFLAKGEATPEGYKIKPEPLDLSFGDIGKRIGFDSNKIQTVGNSFMEDFTKRQQETPDDITDKTFYKNFGISFGKEVILPILDVFVAGSVGTSLAKLGLKATLRDPITQFAIKELRLQPSEITDPEVIRYAFNRQWETIIGRGGSSQELNRLGQATGYLYNKILGGEEIQGLNKLGEIVQKTARTFLSDMSLVTNRLPMGLSIEDISKQLPAKIEEAGKLIEQIKQAGGDIQKAQGIVNEIAKTALNSTLNTLTENYLEQLKTMAQPLFQEARKYKSAEEFVSNHEKLFTGQVGKFDLKRITEERGISLTNSRGAALDFADAKSVRGYEISVTELFISRDAKILSSNQIPNNIKNPLEMANKRLKDISKEPFNFIKATSQEVKTKQQLVDRLIKEVQEAQKPVRDYARSRGFDGIKMPELEGEVVVFNSNILKTKSQLTDFWKEANKKIPQEATPAINIDRLNISQEAKEPTLKQLSTLSKKVDDLIASGKSKDALKSEIDDLREQLSYIEEGFDELPGGKLTKFMSRKEGEFLDFRNPDLAKTPREAEMIRERNAKVMRASESAFQGTSKSDMFDDPDTIREAIEQFQKAKASINNIKEQINSLGKERAVFSKAEKAVSIGIEHRRSQYRSIQDRWTLTDNEMKQFLHGRNISAMDADEWRTFIKEADDFGEVTEKQRNAMAQLKSTIEEKDLKKFENLQASLDLPPIHKMNTEQLINFEKILAEYKAGDEFLPVRMLQTLPNTELAGVKTTREVLEVLSKKSGRAVEDMPIKMTEFHRILGDRRLARQHPFLEVLVERKNRSLLEAEARTIEITDEMDGLIKDARKSKKRGILERLIPKDENITLWSETLEGAERIAIEKKMTKEELVAAKRWDEVRRAYYDYLVKKHAEQKFSRFEGQYFPHVRRGFLEAWKEDGILKAFKEMKDKYRQDQFTMDILNEQTGDILPYEKWIGFAQFRSDKLIPTQNASKAIEAYVTALEKAKHLDEMTPEIMAYVHSLSPRNFSEFGVELDTSLKKFVKEYLNANKGRVPKGFFNPGGSFDVGNRSLIALTRVLDLGWNFTTQIAAPVGENLMTLTMLKPQAYALAQMRARTSQAKVISTKYKNFVGRTPWEEMTRSANDIGDKFMAGAFAIYGQSTRQANRLFLLGKMTDEEFKTGIISVERLTTLQLEMSKYRKVKGLESIMGRTTEAEAVKQYKSWAIPPLTATIENSYTLASIIRKDGVAKALSSDAGKELFYSIGIGSAIGLYTYTKYRELKDKGGKRTFMEDIAFKAMRDGVSIFGAFDPTMWSGVRVADFLEDLARASADLIMLETYKTTGELKAPKEFERLLTPAILKRVLPDEEKSPAKTGLPVLPKLPKLPQLPKLPKIGK